MTTWQDKILTAARNTKTGAIVRAALQRNEKGAPTFGASATITSDGFLIADFTSCNGEHHMGAFVGEYAELAPNLAGLAKHCGLTKAQTTELTAAVNVWCGVSTPRDYRRFAS